MPTRNVSAIGPSGNVKPIPVYHAIPPAGAAIMKITVDTDSGEIDITDLISEGTFNVGVTSTIGDFDLGFLDPDKTNYNLISLFDDVYLYADYGSAATTKRFRFKIENKGFVDFKVTISGRGIGMILADRSIIYQTTDSGGTLTYKNKSDVIQEIIEANFPDITDFSNIETDTTQIQKSYFEVPFFDIIEELCGNDKYFYLDKDLAPHYFTKGSIQNSTEAIADVNLVAMNDNSDNAEGIYTRVRVYGKTEDGIPIIYTHNIGTTNTGGFNKDYVINNTSIVNLVQAQLLAEQKADELTNSTRIGDIVTLLLPTLVPGEGLFISLPEYDISPSFYNIREFSLSLDNTGDIPYKTSFTIEKKRINNPEVIKNILKTQKEITENDNDNDMDFSKIFNFDTDEGTFNNCERFEDTDGGYSLRVVDQNSIATWTSPEITVQDELSRIEIKISQENGYFSTESTSGNIGAYISIDSSPQQNLKPKQVLNLDGGTTFKIQIVFFQDVLIKSLGALYSTN